MSTRETGAEPPERFTPEWLAWARERAAKTGACPRCRANAGRPCRTVRRAGGMHRARFELWAGRYVEAVA
jgi:hypothetical protein